MFTLSEEVLERVSERLRENATLVRVNAEFLPRAVRDVFEGYSRMCIDPSAYRPGNFEGFLAVHYHRDNIVTYCAWQQKTHVPVQGGQQSSSHIVYFVDFDQGVLGVGELRYGLQRTDDFFRDKPFIDHSFYEKDFEPSVDAATEAILNQRRFILMNEIALGLYGFSAHSETLFPARARGVSPELTTWDHFVSAGMAIQYMEGNQPRYRFLV